MLRQRVIRAKAQSKKKICDHYTSENKFHYNFYLNIVFLAIHPSFLCSMDYW